MNTRTRGHPLIDIHEEDGFLHFVLFSPDGQPAFEAPVRRFQKDGTPVPESILVEKIREGLNDLWMDCPHARLTDALEIALQVFNLGYERGGHEVFVVTPAVEGIPDLPHDRPLIH